MLRIKKAFQRLADRLGVNHRKLRHARRKTKNWRERAQQARSNGHKAEAAADRARADDNPKSARKQDRKAARCHVRAHHYSAKAQWWIARTKELLRKIHHLEKLQVVKEAELAKWEKEHKLTIRGDKVTGGTARNRLKAAALKAAAKCSDGSRRNVYSQAGAYTVSHGITGEPSGYRTDCSQFVTSMYHSADLPDPNGENWSGGYTGTLVREGKQVNRADLKPGDLILYGSGAAHHVEMYVGPGDRTIGHGSASVDEGVIDLFGDSDYRLMTYL